MSYNKTNKFMNVKLHYWFLSFNRQKDNQSSADRLRKNFAVHQLAKKEHLHTKTELIEGYKYSPKNMNTVLRVGGQALGLFFAVVHSINVTL